MWVIAAILLELPIVFAYILFVTTILYLVHVLALLLTWPITIALATSVYIFTKTQQHVSVSPSMQQKNSNHFVVIIGAGLAGVCAAVKLKLQGINFVILEKTADVGGTWSQNRYPACACDTMSHLYSYSFRLNPDWSKWLASQSEILQYIKDTCREYGINDSHLKLNTSVEKCTFDTKLKEWNVFTSTGERITCNFVISAVGILHVPKYPNIPGRDVFRGDSFHTACWMKDFDWQDKRVGVVGTGASSIQVTPQIANGCKQLYVFQRSPPWVSPKMEIPYPKVMRIMFKYIPFLMLIKRYYIFFRLETIFQIAFYKNSYIGKVFQWVIKQVMLLQVNDPGLKSKIIPEYTLGCKRILISNDYLTSFNRENVTLVDSGIKNMTEDGLTTNDGDDIKLDAIIYATGFDALKSLGGRMRVERPRDGTPWDVVMGDIPSAYLGTFYDGFPNFFTLLGPSTELGHNSILWMIEQQMNLVSQAINTTITRSCKTIELKAEAKNDFQKKIKTDMKHFVFSEPCNSWYQNETGFNFCIWPSHCLKFWWKTRRLNHEHFTFN